MFKFIFTLLFVSLLKAQQDDFTPTFTLTFTAASLITGQHIFDRCICDGVFPNCNTGCPFNIFVTANGERRQVPRPNPSSQVVFINENLNQRFFPLVVEFFTEDRTAIDVWEFRNFHTLPGQNFILAQAEGQFRNGRLTMRANWTCIHNFGSNCMASCGITTPNGFCDPRTGTELCFPGFTSPPECIPTYCQSSLCLNGGTCQVQNQRAICTCINGFTGPRCENPP